MANDELRSIAGGPATESRSPIGANLDRLKHGVPRKYSDPCMAAHVVGRPMLMA